MLRRNFLISSTMGLMFPTIVGAVNNTPSKNELFDVVVCGGGVAGHIAAIQSARLGAKVLLIESGSQLGGTMTTGGVNFPGLFHAWGKQIIAGIGWNLVCSTVKLHGDTLPNFTSESTAHWQKQVKLNEYLYACIAEEEAIKSGVQIMYYSFPLSIKKASNGIWNIVCAARNLQFTVNAKQIIDCTGNASATELAGFKRMASDGDSQPGTLIFHISNYDLSKLNLKEIRANYALAVSRGELGPHELWVEIGGLLRERGFNTQNVLNANSDTSKLFTDTNISARASFLRIFRFLKSQKGLENVKVDCIKTECGVRETYRVLGETIITGDDYISARSYPDSVAYTFYPIDLHTREGVKPRHLKAGMLPTIPLSALVPKGASNFLIAGRCISSDRIANSALRVQASCMAMGQVSGVAAALSIKQNCSPLDLDLNLLKKVLVENGAIVPKA